MREYVYVCGVCVLVYVHACTGVREYMCVCVLCEKKLPLVQ